MVMGLPFLVQRMVDSQGQDAPSNILDSVRPPRTMTEPSGLLADLVMDLRRGGSFDGHGIHQPRFHDMADLRRESTKDFIHGPGYDASLGQEWFPEAVQAKPQIPEQIRRHLPFFPFRFCEPHLEP